MTTFTEGDLVRIVNHSRAEYIDAVGTVVTKIAAPDGTHLVRVESAPLTGSTVSVHERYLVGPPKRAAVAPTHDRVVKQAIEPSIRAAYLSVLQLTGCESPEAEVARLREENEKLRAANTDLDQENTSLEQQVAALQGAEIAADTYHAEAESLRQYLNTAIVPALARCTLELDNMLAEAADIPGTGALHTSMMDFRRGLGARIEQTETFLRDRTSFSRDELVEELRSEIAALNAKVDLMEATRPNVDRAGQRDVLISQLEPVMAALSSLWKGYELGEHAQIEAYEACSRIYYAAQGRIYRGERTPAVNALLELLGK